MIEDKSDVVLKKKDAVVFFCGNGKIFHFSFKFSRAFIQKFVCGERKSQLGYSDNIEKNYNVLVNHKKKNLKKKHFGTNFDLMNLIVN